MRVEAGKPRRRTRPPQLEVERTNRLEPIETFIPLASNQRMLEQGEQGHRCEVLGCRRSNAEQQRTRGTLRQGPPGAVVGLDPPAPQQSGDPCRQLAVWGHERARL